jgi:hypothetical protein
LDTYLPSIRDAEGHYQGPWRWDEDKNCIFRNLATALDVQETISAVRKKGGEDSIQTHSGAMPLQYLESICICLVLRPILGKSTVQYSSGIIPAPRNLSIPEPSDPDFIPHLVTCHFDMYSLV